MRKGRRKEEGEEEEALEQEIKTFVQLRTKTMRSYVTQSFV